MLKDIKKHNKLPGDKDFVKETENTNIKRYIYIYLVIIYELCKRSYIAQNKERWSWIKCK